jgi:hypothetical protein
MWMPEKSDETRHEEFCSGGAGVDEEHCNCMRGPKAKGALKQLAED